MQDARNQSIDAHAAFQSVVEDLCAVWPASTQASCHSQGRLVSFMGSLDSGRYRRLEAGLIMANFIC